MKINGLKVGTYQVVCGVRHPSEWTTAPDGEYRDYYPEPAGSGIVREWHYSETDAAVEFPNNVPYRDEPTPKGRILNFGN